MSQTRFDRFYRITNQAIIDAYNDEIARAFNLMRNVSLKDAPMAMTIVMFCVIPMLTYHIFGRLWLELNDYRLTKKGTA